MPISSSDDNAFLRETIQHYQNDAQYYGRFLSAVYCKWQNLSLTQKFIVAIIITAVAGASTYYLFQFMLRMNIETNSSSLKMSPRNICTQSPISSLNKPQGLKVGAMNGQMEPLSCVKNIASDQCKQEKEELKSYYSDGSKLEILFWRNQITNRLFQWSNDLHAKNSILRQSLSKIEDALLRKLFILKESSIAFSITTNWGKGKCGELANIAILHLMEYALDTGKNFKIQLVKVSSATNPLEGFEEESHNYLLLNSNIKDIVISADKNKLTYYLDSASGMICDPWNDYFGKFRDDTSGLYYKNKKGWDLLEIKTIDFDFSELRQQKNAFKEIICEELNMINTKLAKKNGCTI